MPTERRPRLGIEAVIIIRLCLKLLLTAAFIVLAPSEDGLPLQPRQAFAQEKKEAPKPAAPPAKAPAAKPPAGKPDKDKAKEPPADKPDDKPRQDPTEDLSKKFKSLSDALTAREQALDQREARLTQRQKALDVLEAELKKRLAEIEETRKKLTALVEKHQQLSSSRRF